MREASRVLALAPRPEIPLVWELQQGWTRYYRSDDGIKTLQVPWPLEESVVFDTEVLYKVSQFPVMATAVSDKAWYVWLSPQLFGQEGQEGTLIPFGESRLIVGHHVAFDRVRIQEEYGFKDSGLAFLDTMSLHVTIGGLSSQQRGSWLKYKKEKELGIENDAIEKSWADVGAPNNLLDVYKLYTGKYLDKEARSKFDATDIKSISDPETLQSLVTYCASDVAATHELLSILLPRFLQKCPHPVSFAGILHMGKSYLTVTKDWTQFIKDAETKCNEFQASIEKRLTSLAFKALETDPAQRAEDKWLKYLDWEITKPRKKDPPEFDYLVAPGSKAELVLAPKWYKDLWDPKLKRIRIATSKRVSPYLLKLEWKGHPIRYSSIYGWMYQVPVSRDNKYHAEPLVFELDENSEFYDPIASHDTEHVYFRVPHPEGEGKNCGNPLSKNYLSAFEDGTLSSAYNDAKEILKLNAQCSYWVSARQRIKDQFVIWNNSDNSLIGDISAPDGSKVGVILPQSVTMGTVTRRSVEATWMTAANAKVNRIGSELKSLIKAPKGYRFVGADVDSQELWIASLLGDAQFGIHGASAIGFMTLQGTKHLKTDLHSVTGAIIGVSRDSAKVFNYSRIYGAGRMHACQLLLKNNPSMDRKEAERKVLQLYMRTKGQKYTIRSRTIPSGIPRQFWHGGSESFMFNAMEKIANSPNPKTPVLGCEIPDSLLPEYVGNNFLTSRVNWVVQSSGVDYLHLLLVAITYLFRRMRIDGRFLISIHDEIRFLVKDNHCLRAALALQLANLWVRALFSESVGISNLPQNVAFFSSIDVDHVLRKEVDIPCLTPSNNIPISNGESLDIYQILNHFSEEDLAAVFGQELDSVKTLLEKGFGYKKDSMPALDKKWINIQMTRSRNDLDMALSPRISKRGYLESYDVDMISDFDQC